MEFAGQKREEIYGWVDQTLRQQRYEQLKRTGRGLVRSYIGKMTGLSRAQMTRLITLLPARRAGEAKAIPAAPVSDACTPGPMPNCWPAWMRRTRHSAGRQRRRSCSGSITILAIGGTSGWRGSRWRTCTGCGEAGAYRQRRVVYQPTRATQVSIGERRAPQPEGRPGYLRVDTVHQGDWDGVKGVYHINAVDEVTQWQVVGATAQISEAWLLPVLEAMLEQFPFQMRGFHSDNGSEFINHTVAKLLNKLLIEQTKSRPRHSNDNGLVESKNGAVVRKHMGYGYIAAPHAAAIESFYEQHFNPYLNFHRPCGVPESVTDAKGKERSGVPLVCHAVGDPAPVGRMWRGT